MVLGTISQHQAQRPTTERPAKGQASNRGNATVTTPPIPDKKYGDTRIREHVVVFKRKRLSVLESGTYGCNIYENRLSGAELDHSDSSKSRVSCLRCRRFKKKCSRSLPECCNCKTSEDLCIYAPRKHKRKKDPKKPEEEWAGPERARLPSIGDILGSELGVGFSGDQKVTHSPGMHSGRSISGSFHNRKWSDEGVSETLPMENPRYCWDKCSMVCLDEPQTREGCSKSHGVKNPFDLKTILN